MSKYNVGDVIKLRDDLEVGKVYGRINFATKMEELKNKPVEIFYRGFQGDYTVEEGWIINDEMIKGLWEECKEKQDKLKLIDVLNMIANGELKEGTKVKYACFELTYDNEMLINDKGDLYAVILRDMSELNVEVELIEPPCEHEWKDIETHRMGEGLINKGRRCKKCGLEEVEERNVEADETIEPTKIEEMACPEIYNGITRRIIDKLNEVIRYINRE